MLIELTLWGGILMVAAGVFVGNTAYWFVGAFIRGILQPSRKADESY